MTSRRQYWELTARSRMGRIPVSRSGISVMVDLRNRAVIWSGDRIWSLRTTAMHDKERRELRRHSERSEGTPICLGLFLLAIGTDASLRSSR